MDFVQAAAESDRHLGAAGEQFSKWRICTRGSFQEDSEEEAQAALE